MLLLNAGSQLKTKKQTNKKIYIYIDFKKQLVIIE